MMTSPLAWAEKVPPPPFPSPTAAAAADADAAASDAAARSESALHGGQAMQIHSLHPLALASLLYPLPHALTCLPYPLPDALALPSSPSHSQLAPPPTTSSTLTPYLACPISRHLTSTTPPRPHSSSPLSFLCG
ncbi:unnamed protein product [Closterium sp. NIES-54]